MWMLRRVDLSDVVERSTLDGVYNYRIGRYMAFC